MYMKERKMNHSINYKIVWGFFANYSAFYKNKDIVENSLLGYTIFLS